MTFKSDTERFIAIKIGLPPQSIDTYFTFYNIKNMNTGFTRIFAGAKRKDLMI